MALAEELEPLLRRADAHERLQDCANVGSYFRVVGSDPHGFDGDSDGIACES